ncbi:MAG: hypothetical protein NTZ25_00145 [Candidatus Peregrinibacteria bacterium]|nr:hypothetical protein [Candidatus Peregrinibacteria bacterium]
MSENRDEITTSDEFTCTQSGTIDFSSKIAEAREELTRAAIEIGGPNMLDSHWIARSAAADMIRENGVRASRTTFFRRVVVKGLTSKMKEGIDGKNVLRPLIHYTDANFAVEDLAELKISLDPDGTYTSKSGRVWATVPAIASKLGVSEHAIDLRLDGVSKFRARNYLGKPVWVYKLDAIKSKVEKDLLEPRATREAKVGKNGHYENADGKWITIEAFYNSLTVKEKKKTSPESLRRRANKNCRNLDAIDREGRSNCKVYHLEDLKKLSILKQEKKVDQRGIYTDPETGMEWASLGSWEKIFRVSTRALITGIEQTFGSLDRMKTTTVFSSNKREYEMFSRQEIEKALSYIFDDEDLLVNEVSTKIEEVEGEIRESILVTVKEFADIIPLDRISNKRLNYYHRAGMTESVDRRSGAPRQAVDLNAAIATFRSEITDILESMDTTNIADEVTDKKGRWITITQFLNERRTTEAKANVENPRRFIANTDQAQRIRRMNSKNELTYLYLESDLKKITL